MDVALAIWQINPAAEYRLTDDKTAVLEWRGPGPEPTPAELEAAWADYQANPPAPAVDPVQAIVQAVLSAPDCPPGVRKAILDAQQAQAAPA